MQAPKLSTIMLRTAILSLVAMSAACSSSSGSTSVTSNPGSSKLGSVTTTHGGIGATSTTLAGSPDPNAKEIVPPGDIPDTQVFVAYAPASNHFSVKYPEGWAQRVDGQTATFTDKFNTMQVSETAAAIAPTVASVQATDAPRLQATLKNFKLVKVEAITRPAGNVVHTAYSTVSGVDAVTGKTIVLDVDRYEFFAAGKLVTITLSASKGSDNVDPWSVVTKSFGWK